jgi:hypothetical protein
MNEENVKYKATGYQFFFYKPSSCDKINDKVHQIIKWLQWPASDQLIRDDFISIRDPWIPQRIVY